MTSIASERPARAVGEGRTAAAMPQEPWRPTLATAMPSADGSAHQLCVDGTMVADSTRTGTIGTNSAEPMTIGSNRHDFDEPCTGLLDRVHIFARAMGEIERQALVER